MGLSAAQQRLVEQLREGWELWQYRVTGSASPSRFRLKRWVEHPQPIGPKQELLTVRRDVVFQLQAKQVIVAQPHDAFGRRTRYVLS